jgi:hypothetical protein
MAVGDAQEEAGRRLWAVVMRYRSTSVYYELGLGRIPQVSEFSMEYPFFYLFKSAEISDTSPIRIREYPRGISIRYGIRHWYVSFVKYPHIIAGHRYGRTSTSCVPGLRTMLWSWVCGGGCPLGSVITSPKAVQQLVQKRFAGCRCPNAGHDWRRCARPTHGAP